MELIYTRDLRWEHLGQIEAPCFAQVKVRNDLVLGEHSGHIFKFWDTVLREFDEWAYHWHRVQPSHARIFDRLQERLYNGEIFLVHRPPEHPSSPVLSWEADAQHADNGRWRLSNQVGWDFASRLEYQVNRIEYDREWQRHFERDNARGPAVSPTPKTRKPREKRRQVPLNPHAGLHNRAQLTPDFDTSAESFKTTRQVDMRNLSPEDKVVSEALKDQGWNEDKVKQVLKSGDDFTETPYQAGDKMYSFNTADRPRNLDNSAYLLDETGMADVKRHYFKQGHWDKEGVKDCLELPCFNQASTIDAMEVTTPTTGIQSTIGKATELLRYDGADGYTTGTIGKIMGGGGRQVTLTTSALKLLPGK